MYFDSLLDIDVSIKLQPLSPEKLDDVSLSARKKRKTACQHSDTNDIHPKCQHSDAMDFNTGSSLTSSPVGDGHIEQDEQIHIVKLQPHKNGLDAEFDYFSSNDRNVGCVDQTAKFGEKEYNGCDINPELTMTNLVEAVTHPNVIKEIVKIIQKRQ